MRENQKLFETFREESRISRKEAESSLQKCEKNSAKAAALALNATEIKFGPAAPAPPAGHRSAGTEGPPAREWEGSCRVP